MLGAGLRGVGRRRLVCWGRVARAHTVAFAFDIDGTLLRKSALIEGAKEAMEFVHHTKRPYVVLTNGGGMVEDVKASELSELFGIPIPPERVVLSHTPMRHLVSEYHNLPVLVIGEYAGPVARHYGFHKALSASEYWQLCPTMVPDRFTPPSPLPPSFQPPFDPATEPVHAILAFSDSVMWKQDLQLAYDLLVTHGLPSRTAGAVAALGEADHIPVFVSNQDFQYPATFHHPRLAGGAFWDCLGALYSKGTGKPLRIAGYYGKPAPATFQYAEKLLEEQLLHPHSPFTNISRILMVGDNPESDIHGANVVGGRWRSVLVRSGMWRGEGNHHHHPAHHVAEHVGEVVERVKTDEWR